jgi:two-component system chemotaxis response regulator CheY
MAFCDQCGNKLNEGAKFCGKCGASFSSEQDENISAPVACAQCGAPLEEGEMFCANCGAKVGVAAQYQSVPVQTQRQAVSKVEKIKPDNMPPHVLVVDDSKFLTAQLCQIFTSEGFKIADTATNGAQGVEKYKALYPNIDLVTLDISIPVMNGVSTLEKILEFDKQANVIMVSNLGNENIVNKCLQMGAKSYIVKPLNREKVIERVISALSS